MRLFLRRLLDASVSYRTLFFVTLVLAVLVVASLSGALRRESARTAEWEAAHAQCVAVANTLTRANSNQQARLNQASKTIQVQSKTLDQSTRYRTDSAHYFTILANASVQLGEGADGSCRGGFVKYQDEIVLLTAAHCVEGYVFDIPHRWYEVGDGGFSQPGEQLYRFQIRDLEKNARVDLAFVRVPDWAEEAARERALELAETTPKDGDLVLGLHWSREADIGRSLVMVSGNANGIFPGSRHMYQVSGGSFGGVSGSLRMNVDGKVVGVTATGSGSTSGVVGPNTIRAFLNRHL